MSEKIYDLLNHVEMDLDKYQEMDLSDGEKKQMKDKVLQEVKTMKKSKNSKRKFTGKAAGLVAAAGLAVCVTAVASDVSAAKMLLSNTFQKIISGTKEEKGDDEIKKIYTKIGDESVPVTKEAGDILETSDAGVTIRVSDIYCDGYMLYYTMELETDNKELTAKKIDGISSGYNSMEQEFLPQPVISIDGEENPETLVFRKLKDGTYACVNSYTLYTSENQTGKNPKDYQDGDKIPVNISIKNVCGWDYDHHDQNGDYTHTENVEGEWNLSFAATVDTSKNVTKKINKEDNGVKLLSATRTKGALHLVVQEPNYSTKPYNDKYNDPDRAVTDADGNLLQWLGNYTDIKEDGSCIFYITLLDDGGEDYCFKVTNKNVDNKQIAKIKFHLER